MERELVARERVSERAVRAVRAVRANWSWRWRRPSLAPGTYSLRANARSTMPSSALLTAAPRDSAARRSRPHLCPERAPNPPPAARARARAAPGQWRPVRGEVPWPGRVKERLFSVHLDRRSAAEVEEVLCAAVFRSPSSAVGRWRLVVSGPIRSSRVPLERPVSQLHGGARIAALGLQGGAHHRRTPTNLGTQIDVMGCWCSDHRRSSTSEPISVGPAPECSARTGLSGGVSRLKLGPLAPALCPFVCAQARWKERSLRASISRLACENGANDWLLPLWGECAVAATSVAASVAGERGYCCCAVLCCAAVAAAGEEATAAATWRYRYIAQCFPSSCCSLSRFPVFQFCFGYSLAANKTELSNGGDNGGDFKAGKLLLRKQASTGCLKPFNG